MAGRQLLVAVAIIAVVAVAGGCGTATPSPSTPSAVPVSPPPGTADPSAAPSRTATPAPSREVSYQATEDLRIGDCYEPVEDADDQTLLAAIIVPCEQPHPNEVFGLGDLPGGPDAPFPGVDPVDDDAIELCVSAFESYVGVALDKKPHSNV